ncbi:hypothetical protein [Nevskia ramosa]|uniref:hypothetical protein n=1 Tax=Nevskia ramosa TaxID=64002 RepID=UPI0003B3E7F7|nr:hypothetical protein [Nevskia ramosa]
MTLTVPFITAIAIVGSGGFAAGCAPRWCDGTMHANSMPWTIAAAAGSDHRPAM